MKQTDDKNIYQLLAISDLSEFAAADLIVPTDRDFIDYHKTKPLLHKDTSQKIILKNDMTFKSWRQISGSATITSHTLIPLGFLILLYNKVFEHSSILKAHKSSLLRDHPVTVAINSISSTEATLPSDLVPFAVILGKDVLHQVVHHGVK